MKAKLAILTIAMIAGSVQAQTCKKVTYKAGDVIKVAVSKDLGTRIELPEPITSTPLVTNSLWQSGADLGERHLYIRSPDEENLDYDSYFHEKKQSKKENKKLEKTMMFATTTTGNYDFLITESDRYNVPCIVIKHKAVFFHSQAKKRDAKKIAHDSFSAKAYSEQSVTKPKLNPLQKYGENGDIHTGYKWDRTKAIVDDNKLKSVYDDSRVTYFRMDKKVKSIVSITGVTNGQSFEVPISTEDNKLFKAYGIFDSMTFHSGANEINITK